MDLAALLAATLSPNPEDRRHAERELTVVEVQPGFAAALLAVVQDASANPTARSAGAIYFKNFVKKYWKQQEDGVSDKIGENDRHFIKASIVTFMITAPSSIQVQLSEAVSLIADNDFPEKWPNLVQELISKLNVQDYTVNLGVLRTAHPIFKRWRHQFRSDKLFAEIKGVLDEFAGPFLQFFLATDAVIDANANNRAALILLFDCLYLITRIFFSLNSQDLPEFFEDNQQKFMPILLKYLKYSNNLLDSDDDEPGIIEKVKASICQIIDLYGSQYESDFVMLPQFVECIWTLLTTTGQQPKYDMLVSKSIGFLTAVVRPSRHKAMFENALQSICEKIVLPNMCLRDSDIEIFNEDYLEFIRRDLEGSDTDTRRRAATDLIRGLLSHFETEVTRILMSYLEMYFQSYATDNKNWRAKDTALYLVMALSARDYSLQAGTTKLNELIDPIPIFSLHVLPDLQAPINNAVEPFLKVDALKFLLVFRAQLNKDQLISIFPLVVKHLSSSNYVIYTYAAVCIDRILSIRTGTSLLFSKEDIRPYSRDVLSTLLRLMERFGTSPEKLSENDYLMKAFLRVMVISKEDVLQFVMDILSGLTSIISVISANPSNPKFNHFAFEALSTLIRHVCSVSGQNVEQFELLLFPIFNTILQQDISEFSPYVFQLMAQMLSFHSSTTGIPQIYSQIFSSLLHPSLWESHANIPALTGLLETYLAKGSQMIVDNNQIQPILGIYLKLISSRINDHHGLDLLATVYEFVPIQAMRSYNKNITMLLLKRLQESKTPKFTRAFVKYLSCLILLEKPGLAIDDIIGFFNEIQSNLFHMLLQSIILPEVQLGNALTPEERQLFAVAFTKVLVTSSVMLSPPCVSLWPDILKAILHLLEIPVAERGEVAVEDDLYTADIEESGYQASFSKLVSSVKPKRYISSSQEDPMMLLRRGLYQLQQTPAASSLPHSVFALAAP